MKPSTFIGSYLAGAITLIGVISSAAGLSAIRSPAGPSNLPSSSNGTWPSSRPDVANEARNRHQRSLVFPYNGAMGLIVAIAVPLKVPDRNIFMSYNFEGNYNSPPQTNIFTEGFFNYIRGIAPPLQSPVIFVQRNLEGSPAIEDSTDDPPTDPVDDAKTEAILSSSKQARSIDQLTVSKRTGIYTRKKMYRAIEQQLNKIGLDGKKCLLRSICEANDNPMMEHNGILGDLVHLILSPSTSEDENLPPEFYKAERAGIAGSCQRYRKYCKQNVLDKFSFTF
ncbi:uncharacterized protein LOC129753504 [Uranotaenia lowii]|uniref:uncharacterized protein LOC129753504 n=1 Tax=Uranotaenia lowii TaxID=190385 RepID=UPI0024791845|nr:uncharacterized protein LOC129753504 [Uranotaenia lowii]